MIVLDTSAILAILLREEEATKFRDRLAAAGHAMVSAGTAVELAALASRDDDLFAAALAFLITYQAHPVSQSGPCSAK